MIRKGTGKPVELTMRTMCAQAELHTNDRLLFDALSEVKLILAIFIQYKQQCALNYITTIVLIHKTIL